ncbi:MAG TPA: glycerol kinase GlpK [Geminicoccaceae bacterium]|nr:glycerol kinase GlpK [Geminicoccaceae bacterium]
MIPARYVLAIDQGTTSSRAILFDGSGHPVASAQRELQQFFPADGWVEHDPEHIWSDTVAVCREVLERGGVAAGDVAALGITNQRETTLLWERASGRAVHKAIVWQDRRTASLCRELAADGLGGLVQERTGLVVDAYFSATKLAWMLDNVTGARAAAERGELAFGTVDSFLLWRLTGGRVHATDAANAARTMLFDIRTGRWDEELLARLRIPDSVLPEVRDNSGEFGTTEADLLGAAIPVTGMAGDQQAASFGQACFAPGMVKSTYGTGCFALVNTGERMVPSRNRLLTTIAWRLQGRTTYAIEGSIFVAGAAIQWVRDGLRAIDNAAQSEAVARAVPDTGGVYMVPAFTGLGAPWWDPDARGAILGLTRDSGIGHIVRAALESVCYQTSDLMRAMADDMTAAGEATAPAALRVDGGMVANDWLCQYLADILDRPVERPRVIETTALGAACLAGLAVGMYASTDAIAAGWRCERRFEPAMDQALRRRRLAGWHEAVGRVRSARPERAPGS